MTQVAVARRECESFTRAPSRWGCIDRCHATRKPPSLRGGLTVAPRRAYPVCGAGARPLSGGGRRTACRVDDTFVERGGVEGSVKYDSCTGCGGPCEQAPRKLPHVLSSALLGEVSC